MLTAIKESRKKRRCNYREKKRRCSTIIPKGDSCVVDVGDRRNKFYCRNHGITVLNKERDMLWALEVKVYGQGGA